MNQQQHHNNPEPLTPEEQHDLRNAFYEFMDSLPVQQAPSRFWTNPLLTYVNSRQSAFAVAFSIVLAVYVQPFLADFSPHVGEVFYPVGERSPLKEPVIHQMALTHQLEQAEKLILSDSYAPEQLRDIQADIIDRTSILQAYIKESETSGSFDKALSVSADLESQLAAHGTALEYLVESDTTPAGNDIDAFIQNMIAQSQEAAEIQNSVNAKSAMRASDSIASDRSETAIREIGKMNSEIFANIKSFEVPSQNVLLARSTELLRESNELVAAAAEQLSAHNANEANRLLQDALVNSMKVKILIETHERFEEGSADEGPRTDE